MNLFSKDVLRYKYHGPNMLLYPKKYATYEDYLLDTMSDKWLKLQPNAGHRRSIDPVVARKMRDFYNTLSLIRGPNGRELCLAFVKTALEGQPDYDTTFINFLIMEKILFDD